MNDLNPTGKVSRQGAVNKPAKEIKRNVPTVSAVSTAVDRVTLSETTKAQAPATLPRTRSGEIRRDLVQKFRNILENGTYQIKADEIADKIVQKIRENKNSIIF